MFDIQPTNKKNDKAGHAPLRRFLAERKQSNCNTESKVTTADAVGEYQIISVRFNNRPKCGPRRTLRIGAGYITEAALALKSRTNKRPRKSKPTFTGPKRHKNNKTPVIAGHCRCGAKAEAPYFERCENCFAEDAERWSGKNQAVITY